MFQALLCPSSGAGGYDVYHIGRVILGLLYVGGEVQLDWSSVRVAGSSTTRVVLEPATEVNMFLPIGNSFVTASD